MTPAQAPPDDDSGRRDHGPDRRWARANRASRLERARDRKAASVKPTRSRIAGERAEPRDRHPTRRNDRRQCDGPREKHPPRRQRAPACSSTMSLSVGAGSDRGSGPLRGHCVGALLATRIVRRRCLLRRRPPNRGQASASTRRQINPEWTTTISAASIAGDAGLPKRRS